VLYKLTRLRSTATDSKTFRELVREMSQLLFYEATADLRLSRAPDEAVLERLNTEFADLLQHGAIEVIEATPAEVRDNDALDKQRVALYPQHHYGRIRRLIDALNDQVPRDA